MGMGVRRVVHFRGFAHLPEARGERIDSARSSRASGARWQLSVLPPAADDGSLVGEWCARRFLRRFQHERIQYRNRFCMFYPPRNSWKWARMPTTRNRPPFSPSGATRTGAIIGGDDFAEYSTLSNALVDGSFGGGKSASLTSDAFIPEDGPGR